jgi:hypothetical protein
MDIGINRSHIIKSLLIPPVRVDFDALYLVTLFEKH